jgi:hypothetical protein
LEKIDLKKLRAIALERQNGQAEPASVSQELAG